MQMTNNENMKNVLIVDDEKSFILSLLQGLDAYAADFNTITAQNGKAAIEVLNSTKIDLVVTDLKMPELDGFGLLVYMNKAFPETSVIVMSAFCTPEIRARLKTLGAVTILEKPIDFQSFVDHIFAALHAVARGYINGITLPAFMQLIEMERKTCTLKIGSHGKKGFLFFQSGELIDADNGVEQHEKAALDMVCWDNPEIEIESFCSKKVKNINVPLSYILMEGYRMRDELQKDQPVYESAPASVENQGSIQEGAGIGSEAHNQITTATNKEDNIMMTTREILNELATIQSISAVCLVARDGFLLDSIARTGIDSEMIGAIASSGFGASESMGRQLDKGHMSISMIEFEKGPVMLSPIGDDAFLVVVAEKDANLGMIRLKLKKHSSDLALAAAI